jgi:hypothetical protein
VLGPGHLVADRDALGKQLVRHRLSIPRWPAII